MKYHVNSIKQLGLGFLSLALLNSCYFNSAGHIFDKASHKAAVNMEDLTPGSKVYVDGSTYYVELPRYRAGKPVTTQYSIGDKKKKTETLRKTSDTTMVEIPQSYAMYLTGQKSSPKTPPYMQRSKEEPGTIKARSHTLTTVRSPESARHDFHYTSPNAAGWYTLGALDWLCVDLPITCVENCLMICGVAYIALDEMYTFPEEYYSPPSGNNSNMSDYALDYEYERQHKQAERERLEAIGQYYGQSL